MRFSVWHISSWPKERRTLILTGPFLKILPLMKERIVSMKLRYQNLWIVVYMPFIRSHLLWPLLWCCSPLCYHTCSWLILRPWCTNLHWYVPCRLWTTANIYTVNVVWNRHPLTYMKSVLLPIVLPSFTCMHMSSCTHCSCPSTSLHPSVEGRLLMSFGLSCRFMSIDFFPGLLYPVTKSIYWWLKSFKELVQVQILTFPIPLSYDHWPWVF